MGSALGINAYERAREVTVQEETELKERCIPGACGCSEAGIGLQSSSEWSNGVQDLCVLIAISGWIWVASEEEEKLGPNNLLPRAIFEERFNYDLSEANVAGLWVIDTVF